MKHFVNTFFVVAAAVAVQSLPLRDGNLPLVRIDTDAMSVSGVSAGGYMAVQMHVTYSASFMGAGIIAAGPYYCAQDDVAIALSSCMSSGNLIDVSYLAQVTRNTAAFGYADEVANLNNARVWIYSAAGDTVVDKSVVKALEEYYISFLDDPNSIKSHFDLPGEHAMPTLNYGHPCDHLGTPYLTKCNFDAAGELLQHIYGGTLTAPVNDTGVGSIVEFDQSQYVGGSGWAVAFGLAETGFVYVPPTCANAARPCKLHIAFHGCQMTQQDIGLDYVQHAGYNRWADANDIVVLYPQALANTLNPKGCFDW